MRTWQCSLNFFKKTWNQIYLTFVQVLLYYSLLLLSLLWWRRILRIALSRLFSEVWKLFTLTISSQVHSWKTLKYLDVTRGKVFHCHHILVKFLVSKCFGNLSLRNNVATNTNRLTVIKVKFDLCQLFCLCHICWLFLWFLWDLNSGLAILGTLDKLIHLLFLFKKWS